VPVTVSNTGNVPVSGELSITPPDGWGDPLTTSLVLEPGESAQRTLRLQAPEGTSAGSYPVDVEVTSTEAASIEETVSVQIEPTVRASVSKTVVSAGHHPVVQRIQVENTGNVPTSVRLDVLEAPIGWSLETSDTAFELAPGEARNATLTFVRQGEDAPSTGSFVARARLSPEASVEQGSIEETFTGSLNALPPDLTVTSVEPTPEFDVEEGQPVRFDVTVENEGLGPAAPVPVRLFRNGDLVAAGDVRDLGPGEDRSLNFTIEANADLQSVVAAADPRERLVDADRSNNALGQELVAEGTLIPRDVPHPSPLLAVLAFAGLAVAVRRKT
jgi:hypothetical protein